jgi:hypothetical protein
MAMRLASHFSLGFVLAGALFFLSPLAAFSGTANSHSKFAGTYESDVPQTDKDKNPPSMSVSLGADGSATITQNPGGKSGTETTVFGHWADSGNQITVRFDAAEGKPAPPPMIFQPGHDGLQAVTWDHAAWGKVTPPPMKKGTSDWHSGHHHVHIF